MVRIRIPHLVALLVLGAAAGSSASLVGSAPNRASIATPASAKGGTTENSGVEHAPTSPTWNANLTRRTSPGWTTEKVWSRSNDDWEPAIAADPTSPYVYTFTTRYGGPRACNTCPRVAIVMRASPDGGITWGPDQFVCACPGIHGQYDPIAEVDGNGTLHVVWLNGFNPGATYSRSTDHGLTWSTPVSMPSAWSDKPVLAVSADGQDVYVAFNGPSKGDSYVGVSHDGGATFTASVAVLSARYFFAGGAWTSADGQHVAFAESDYNPHYSAGIHIKAIVSNDAGATWTAVRVASGYQQPDCTSAGCYDGFYGPTPTLAGDADGNLVMAYSVNAKDGAPERLKIARSSDFGMTWHDGETLSPRHGAANAIFPAMAATGHGDFRVWWMDTRTGRWNVWYRASSDRGRSWSQAVRLSNAWGGAPYKGARGFGEAYGDYGEMAITNTGKTVAIWGEGPSYYGPGGAWFVRQT